MSSETPEDNPAQWTVIDSGPSVEGEELTYSVRGPESDFMFLRNRSESNLIAAAPDLLEALDSLIDLAEEAIEARKASDDEDDREMIDVFEARLKRGREAIDKATGR